jgi:hypothetical protein
LENDILFLSAGRAAHGGIAAPQVPALLFNGGIRREGRRSGREARVQDEEDVIFPEKRQ